MHGDQYIRFRIFNAKVMKHIIIMILPQQTAGPPGSRCRPRPPAAAAPASRRAAAGPTGPSPAAARCSASGTGRGRTSSPRRAGPAERSPSRARPAWRTRRPRPAWRKGRRAPRCPPPPGCPPRWRRPTARRTVCWPPPPLLSPFCYGGVELSTNSR